LQRPSTATFEGEEPRVRLPQMAPASGSLLSSFGGSLTELVRQRQCAAETIGRREEIRQVATAVLQKQPALALICGEAGVGKSSLLAGVASLLLGSRPELNVRCVDLALLWCGTLFDSERGSLLKALLREAVEDGKAVVALEHAELAITSAPQGGMLLAQALDSGARLAGTVVSGHAQLFLGDPVLARRAEIIHLEEGDPHLA
jgi:ATP-dependent Clp protease ATP-binding subunit ClpA